MTYKNVDELPAWQAAAALYNRVLDLLEAHGPLFSSGFRGQLDRAALSVSNNIAEGFERTTSNELLAFLGIARGSAGEVRSMMAVVRERPRLAPARALMREVSELSDGCVKQIMGWTQYLEGSDVKGKRHLTPERRREKRVDDTARRFRRDFLLGLKPEHPLYNTDEAKAAREERDAEGRQ
jgi:four helix bundle protein